MDLDWFRCGHAFRRKRIGRELLQRTIHSVDIKRANNPGEPRFGGYHIRLRIRRSRPAVRGKAIECAEILAAISQRC
jgi:hypothetical protein